MIRLRERSQRLLVVVGASGAGKDSVIGAWLESLPPQQRPHRARRTITRAAGDTSEAHEALDDAAFRAARAGGAFAFAWQAHGLHYGIRWTELAPLERGDWVVMNGSRAHLPTLRALAPGARVVEISAPDDLRDARLVSRAREARALLPSRLSRRVPDSAADLHIANDTALAVAAARLGEWWWRLDSLATSR